MVCASAFCSPADSPAGRGDPREAVSLRGTGLPVALGCFLPFQVGLNISMRSRAEIDYHVDREIEPGLEITKEKRFLV